MKEVQALSLTTIAKMVQTAGPQQIRPHLPRLVPAMLESLSGMEVGRGTPFSPFTCACCLATGAAEVPKMVELWCEAAYLNGNKSKSRGNNGMQDARLNYVEQHAERIGLDGGRLENLRVAASRR